jgi:DNA-directed RNA polymerase specialized sigma24 family protein
VVAVSLLRAWAGLSFREIGRALGVSTFTAASRWRLALARLRRAFGVER